VRDAVARVLPPERRRWISFSHVEADECGSLNQWLAVAPLCGRIAALVSMNDLAGRPPRALGDGEALALGARCAREPVGSGEMTNNARPQAPVWYQEGSGYRPDQGRNR